MTAQIHRISGLHGHGLAAFERAGEIIDEHMRTSATSPSATLHRFSADDNHRKWAAKEARRSALSLVVTQPPPPKIVRVECAYCAGSGQRVIRSKGHTIASTCAVCAGNGTICVEEITCHDVGAV